MRIRLLTFLVIILTLSLVIVQAYAHIPCMCGNSPDKCECFIQLGDKGPAVREIVDILINKGYLNNPRKKTEFTPEVRGAVIKFQTDNNLEATGWMDDETLDALLFDELPDPSVKYEEERWRDIVFIPTDGGIRYHLDPNCCEMHHPRMITRVNAEKLGISHCGLKSEPYASDLNILMFSSAGLGSRILPDEYYLDASSDLPDDTASHRSLHTDDASGIYIGNKSTHIFHRDSCSSVKRMSEKNKVEFLSRDDAIAEGFDPCKNCNP